MSIPFEDSWYIPKIRWQNVQVLTQELLPQKELFQEKFCPLFAPIYFLLERRKYAFWLCANTLTQTHTHRDLYLQIYKDKQWNICNKYKSP